MRGLAGCIWSSGLCPYSFSCPSMRQTTSYWSSKLGSCPFMHIRWQTCNNHVIPFLGGTVISTSSGLSLRAGFSWELMMHCANPSLVFSSCICMLFWSPWFVESWPSEIVQFSFHRHRTWWWTWTQKFRTSLLAIGDYEKYMHRNIPAVATSWQYQPL